MVHNNEKFFFLSCFLLVLLCEGYLFGSKIIRHSEQASSFIQTRPIYMDIIKRNHLALQYMYKKSGLSGSLISVDTSFSESFSRDNAHSYFFPKNKSYVTIVGDSASVESQKQRDVRAEWLGLPSTTNSILYLKPYYRTSGFVVEYNQNIKNLLSFDMCSHWQVGIRLPVVIVENMVSVHEKSFVNNDDHSIASAFNEVSWIAQKITPAQTTVGFSDIQLYMSGSSYAQDHFIFGAHSGIVLPVAPDASHTYLFSPVRGNNGRFGIYGGVDMQVVLNETPRIWNVLLCASIESYYFFHSTVIRTFDLKHKPWSRFLNFIRNDLVEQMPIPGVNVLTKSAHVRGQAYADFSLCIRFLSDYFQGECGYGIWGHDAERIEYIKDDLEPIFGIAGTNTLTASNSTIASKADNDSTFKTIKTTDIDLLSGASLSALNHSFYVAFGTAKKGEHIDGFLGCGGMIEKGQRRGSLPLWTVWLKVGATI